MVTETALRTNWHLLSLFFSVNHGCVTIPLIFATSLLDKHLGYAGSALLYVVTCICSLFLSAPVVITLGQRTGLALAMMLYTAFVGAFAVATGLPANSVGQWVFFLAGSFLGGIAASILWTAQGSYLERSVAALVEASGKDREAESAQLSSVFAVYYLLLEVGLKLLCSFMLEHIKPWITFTLYFILALLSTVGVAGLRQFGPTRADPLQPGSPPPKRPALAAKLFAALELWCLPELWCLSFTNMTFGFAAAFLNGYVNGSYTGPQLGNSWVGYYATATALVAALCSRVFGAIAVRLGSKGPILLIGSLCFAGIPALVLLADLDDWGHWLIIPYILQGCGRAVYESTNRGVFATPLLSLLLVMPSQSISPPPGLPIEVLTSLFSDSTTARVASAAIRHPRPHVAPAFRADVIIRHPGTVLEGQYGVYIRDAENQRFRETYCQPDPMFRPTDHLCMDKLNVNHTGLLPGNNMNATQGVGKDSVCKVFPTPYADFLALLQYAHPVGNSTVGGEPCSLWFAVIDGHGYAFNLSACIAADGVPRQFNQTSNIAYKVAGNQFITFANVSVGPQPKESLLPSEACSQRWPTPPCPGTGAVVPLTLYRVRGAQEPDSLENRNVGDALGDMGFFCDVSGLDERQVVSSWAVEANSSWGQYAYCIFQGKNVCFSSTGRQVGRESALGLGEGALQGQCSNNTDVGSWFSLPAEGQCPDGADVGHAGCTWRARHLRTVSARCIMEDRGLKAVCAKERGHAPMSGAAAVFTAALASSNPALGGCPDVAVSWI